MSGPPCFLGYLCHLKDYKDHEVLRERKRGPGSHTAQGSRSSLVSSGRRVYLGLAQPCQTIEQEPAPNLVSPPNRILAVSPTLSTSFETHKTRTACSTPAIPLHPSRNCHERPKRSHCRPPGQCKFYKRFQSSSWIRRHSDSIIHYARHLSAHRHGVECRNPTLLFQYAGTIEGPCYPTWNEIPARNPPKTLVSIVFAWLGRERRP